MADANIIIKIVDQTRGGMSSVVNQVKDLDRGAQNAGSTLQGLQKRIVAVGAAIATGFVTKSIIETTARFEDLRDSLDIVAGSAQAGGEAFAFIQDFATKTQFGVETLTETFIKLKAAGIEPTEALLTTFTDTAAVTTDQIGSLTAITDLFARTTSGGLGLEELNRLADRGVPVFKILEQQLGITRLQVSEFGKTAEGARQITEALITGLNQEFGGATQARLDNLSTAMSNFGIAVTNALGVFGEGFAPQLVIATDNMTGFIQKNEDLIRSLGRLVGEGLNFVIENFDKLVIAAGAFFAAVTVAKIVEIVSSFAKLTAGIKLLNAAFLTNPIALAIAAISAAVLLLIDQWDNLKDVAISAFNKIEIAGLTLQKWFYQFLDLVINDTVNGFLNMGKRAANVMKAIAAAAKDPLNAFEAFREELARGEEQIKDNQVTVIDFSGKIEDLERRIDEARKTTDDHTDSVEDNSDELDKNTGETADNERATENLTDAVDDNAEALAAQTEKLRQQYEAYGQSRIAANAAAAAVDEVVGSIQNETREMGLNERQRETANALIEAQEAALTALSGERVRVTAEQRQLIYEMVANEEYHTTTVEGLSQTQIQSIRNVIDEKRIQAERTAEYNRQIQDFERETSRLTEQYYRDTTSKVQQLEDSMQDYIARARALGLENAKETQDAIAAYEHQINRQRLEDHRETMDGLRSEYSAVYDDMYGLIEKFTGKSRTELDRYNQYAKLLFGVDILGSVDGFIMNSIASMNGTFVPGMNQAAAQTGQYIGQGVFGNNGIASQGIGGFVGYALQAFGINGGGLLGAVTALFGGLGVNLQGIFSNVFGWISNGLSGVGGFLSNIFGGIVDFGSGLFGGIGNFFSGIVSGIGNFFSGLFADGGYIKPGTFGIVGEAGPEFVAGPATVTSARDTAAMMGGGNVNVNFSIQALDARGIDTLLIERKPLIADIVRDAVASSGRRI